METVNTEDSKQPGDRSVASAPEKNADPFDVIRARAAVAGLDVEDDLDFDDEPALTIEIPSGRDKRKILVFADEAEEFAATRFEDVRFLGRLQATYDVVTGEIEAGIVTGLRNSNLGFQLKRIPGAVPVGGPSEGDSDSDEEMPSTLRASVRVVIGSDPASSLEISPPTGRARLLRCSRMFTLKMQHGSDSTHDAALQALENVAWPLFFDLDLRYGVALELAVRRPRPSRRRQVSSEDPPDYPQNRYAVEPLELYRYGRSAQGLPLLEFLAYYQALEYFFPHYTSEEVLNSLRAHLIDPRFSARRDGDLHKLITLVRPVARTSVSEREQLRATIVGCIDAASLEEFLTSDLDMQAHFCGNRQAVNHVKKIRLAGDADLRHQVADRIYDVRCRIVHAKQDGGDSGVELLLPASDEARALLPDIDLVRMLAQRVILARATQS